MKIKEVVGYFISYKIGNSNSIFFWYNWWFSIGLLLTNLVKGKHTFPPSFFWSNYQSITRMEYGIGLEVSTQKMQFLTFQWFKILFTKLQLTWNSRAHLRISYILELRRIKFLAQNSLVHGLIYCASLCCIYI